MHFTLMKEPPRALRCLREVVFSFVCPDLQETERTVKVKTVAILYCPVLY